MYYSFEMNHLVMRESVVTPLPLTRYHLADHRERAPISRPASADPRVAWLNHPAPLSRFPRRQFHPNHDEDPSSLRSLHE